MVVVNSIIVFWMQCIYWSHDFYRPHTWEITCLVTFDIWQRAEYRKRSMATRVLHFALIIRVPGGGVLYNIPPLKFLFFIDNIDIVTCQRGGASNEPPGQRQDTGPGILTWFALFLLRKGELGMSQYICTPSQPWWETLGGGELLQDPPGQLKYYTFR